MKKVCLIVTDAVSFNSLYRGQLEFLRDNSDFSITLISGGDLSEIKKLQARNIGKFLDFGFKREPSVAVDIISLTRLFMFLLFNRFDLIVYSTPKALLLGSLASSLTFQKKRVAMIRGRAYENYTGKNRNFFAFLDKVSLKISTETLFISNSLKKLYIQEGITEPVKASILGLGSSNGVDTTRFLPSKIKSNTFTVVMVGRICLDKGIKDLLEILSRLNNRNIKILLFGSVEGSESQDLLDDIVSNYSFVEYCGQTDNVEDVFKRAHLHLFLTHREGFGNVAIEAASSGVPTFSYDVVGVKDSVKEGISGKRFPAGDYDKIAAAIDDASTDPLFLQKYSKARDWAVENFEQQKVWRNYLEYFNYHLDP